MGDVKSGTQQAQRQGQSQHQSQRQTFRWSAFGQKFAGESGVLRLMEDMGEAARQPGAILLGGGNPGRIPEVDALFHAQMQRILENKGLFSRLVGNYDNPAGPAFFARDLAALLRDRYGWQVGPENILTTAGSQTGFFFLFNLLAGPTEDGGFRRILLPVTPEYIGYEESSLSGNYFVSYAPEIEYLPNHMYKYKVDFDALTVGPDIGAICVSRPTNPTGNVLTRDELTRLSELAKAHDIPFIIDNAYGAPFPGIIYTTEAEQDLPDWEEHMILCMSLSKLGLPGVRTGIIIAAEPVIRALTAMNAIISLAPSSMGAALVRDLVKRGDILDISRNLIRPHYEDKAEHAVACVHAAMQDGALGNGAQGKDRQQMAYYIHKPEGAFFLWLWFPNLPINSLALYQRLRDRNVLVLPGQYFFPGLDMEWQHRHECIRVSYAGPKEQVAAGIRIIGEEVRRAFAE
jgi:valine--pyruvate aminotransferase